MIEENVRKKIQDLLARAPALAATSSMGLARDNQHISQCKGWITEALNVIELAVPAPTNAYRRQIEKFGEVKSGRYPSSVGTIAEILRALLQDIDLGLLATLSNRVRAETFGEFLDHAEAYLKESRRKIKNLRI